MVRSGVSELPKKQTSCSIAIVCILGLQLIVGATKRPTSNITELPVRD